MNHLELVAQRTADPATLKDAKKRSDAIADRLRKSNINTLAELAQVVPEPERKTFYMKLVLDTLDKATEGLVPCKSGCSYCCNMATLVTVEEAQVLAKASGRAMTMPDESKFNRHEKEDIREYNGVPCTFLDGNSCSVYASRPLACRIHYSVDRDNLLCQIIPGTEIRTPTFNAMQFNMLAISLYDDPTTIRFADIREFFPKETA